MPKISEFLCFFHHRKKPQFFLKINRSTSQSTDDHFIHRSGVKNHGTAGEPQSRFVVPCSCDFATARCDFATATLRFRPVWVDTDCWAAIFLWMIPASSDGCRLHRMQFAVRVSCFMQLCRKWMGYIYHPQRNCYFVASLSLCCRPCEISLKRGRAGCE